MNKFTPGPWTHEGQGDITGIEDNGFGRGPVDVCSVYLRTVEGRHEANARLIAAAPELLEALEACRNELLSMINMHNAQDPNDGSWLYDHQTICEADLAIARARGEA